MKASDVMTSPVMSVEADATIADTVQSLVEHGFSGLPVVDTAGQLVGIVTEGDLLRRSELGTEVKRKRWLSYILGPGRLAEDYVQAHARRVEEVMTRDVVTVAPDTSLEEVVGLMEGKKIKRVPVTQDGRLVGIITRADLLKALNVALLRRPEPAKGDAAIQEAITAEIAKQPWAPVNGVDVFVRDGVVHLVGVIVTDELRYALKVLAEGIAGTKAVKDHLTYVEPVSGMFIEAPDGPAPEGLTGGSKD
ncbi:CBS domain-containing protein [Chelatococcus asaccharovorans]|uniref:BON domain-containing protein n=1 Tax=Chelatococcus asaccharovorans TaxID=28210 RepID=A0A2V3UA33_9HYPH|nr:CBS domain-containing protein [Chelatococcus asaccharovorans]MBS7705327.1 CBS domain-containing protein [Chelatococcus asaccharovorans]PXW60270.1 BON domain-containing protein [Chelatococcus asaccharovorans]CAH1654790.1 BON domain-containing protein [Chelatococcus asaccharovorans]CAH1685641.1 BON domain-containing protein [Chelatococcus asaccharovorans]